MRRLSIAILSLWLALAPAFAQVGGLSFPGPGPHVTGGTHQVTQTAQSATPQTVASGNTITDSTLTIPSGSNLGLVAAVSYGGTGITCPPTGVTVTWNGVGLSLITSQAAADSIHSCSTLWGLVNPATGNHSLTSTWTGAVSDALIGGVSFSGVNQTGGSTSFIAATPATGTADPSTVTISSATTDAVMGVFTNGAQYTAVSPTQLYRFNSGTTFTSAASDWAVGASSVTLNGTMSTTAQWSAVGVDITPQ